MQKADHGAFPTAKVQTVVPVGPESFADPVGADLSGRKVQDPAHMLVNGAFASIRIRDSSAGKSQITGLPYVFHDRRNQPQSIVGAYVLDAVNDILFIDPGDHGGRAEGLFFTLLFGFEPARLEQVKPVALCGQSHQKLFDPLPALFRIGMGNRHGILGCVAVAESCPASDLDKRSEPGKHDIDLGLIQCPDIEHGVHGVAGRLDIQFPDLFVPVIVQFCVGMVDLLKAAVFFPDAPAFIPAAFSQHEDQPYLFARSQPEIFLKAAAVISSFFKRPGAISMDHSHRITFGMIKSQKRIAQAVKPVGFKGSGKKLISELFIKKIVLNDPVFVVRSRAVQTHLKILIVDHDVMKREFQIRKYAQIPDMVRTVFNGDIPELHVFAQRDRHLLGRKKSVVFAFKYRVGEAVPAEISGTFERLSHGLP